jgi:hypothetical protein
MADPLGTYVHDHLAGAEFAISLLNDLREQASDEHVVLVAVEMLAEIEADRNILKDFANGIGAGEKSLKQSAAWVAQKASRFKLSLGEPLGNFEAIEALSLGVLGKLALWNALKTTKAHDGRVTLPLGQLISRAKAQHERLEALRLQLATVALTAPAPSND